jgi:hypothetical protein
MQVMKFFPAQPGINFRVRDERGGLARDPQPIKRKVYGFQNK